MAFIGACLETLWVDLRLSIAANRMANLKKVMNIEEDEPDEEEGLGLDTPISKIKERSNLIKLEEKKKNKELRAYKKINEQVLASAAKYSPDDCKLDIDIEKQILNHLVRNACTLTGLLTKAQRTQKWINYCYYFMTNREAPLLVHITDSTKELCNAICNIYGFGKIYPDVNIANLRIYDCFDDAFGTDPEFVLSVAKLQQYNTAEMQLAIANRKAIDVEVKDANNTNEEYDPSKIVPIRFSKPNESNIITSSIAPDVKGNVPDSVAMILEAYIKPIMQELGCSYYYDLSPYTGRVVMTVDRSGYPETYEFDLSSLGYNNYALVAPVASGNSRVLVPITETDLLKNLLTSCFHIVDPDTENYLYSKMFKNLWIYKIIDLGDLDTKKMGIDEMNQLGDSISNLFGWCQAEHLPIPRLRFCSYESPSKFTLISDSTVRNPLADIDDVECTILEGLVMSVDGCNLSYRYNDVAKSVDTSVPGTN